MSDLAKILPVDRRIDILYPGTENKTGLVWVLMSIDDERLKPIKNKIRDERMKLAARGKSFKATQVEDYQLQINTAATLGWEWGNDFEGDPALFNGTVPDFNTKNVREVLSTLVWVKEQVDDEMNATEDFFTK